MNTMNKAASFSVDRTGRTMDMASSEFRVTYPDGYVGSLWSPPWHDMTPEREFAEARAKARSLYAAGTHRAPR